MTDIKDTGEKIGGARKDFSKNALRLVDLVNMNDIEKLNNVEKENIFHRPNYSKLIDDEYEPKLVAVMKYIYDSIEVKPDFNKIENFINMLNIIEEDFYKFKRYDEFKSNFLAIPYTHLNYGENFRDQNVRNTLFSVGADLFSSSKLSKLERKADKLLSTGWPKEKIKKAKSELVGLIPERPYLDEIIISNSHRNGKDISPEDFIKHFGFRGVEFGNWLNNNERQEVLNKGYDAFCDLADVLDIEHKQISLNGTLAIGFGSRGRGQSMAHYEPDRKVFNLTKMSGAGCVAHEYFHAMDHFIGEQRIPFNGEIQYATGGHKFLKNYLHRDKIGGVLWKKFVYTMRQKKATKEDFVKTYIKECDKKIIEIKKDKKEIESKINDIKSMGEKVPGFLERNLIICDTNIQKIEEFKIDKKQYYEKIEKTDWGTVNTNYMDEALMINGGKNGYWTEPTEMGARAFESFIFDTMADIGIRNDYLVYGVEEKRFEGEMYRGNPYPKDEERKILNELFWEIVQDFKSVLDFENELKALAKI